MVQTPLGRSSYDQLWLRLRLRLPGSSGILLGNGYTPFVHQSVGTLRRLAYARKTGHSQRHIAVVVVVASGIGRLDDELVA